MHYKLIDKVSSQLPFGMLEFFSGPKVLPLFYHSIGKQEELPYLDGLYTVFSPEVFEKDLEFLLRKYIPIDLEGFIKYKTTGNLPGKSNYFFLSFDDGLRQCSEIIAPILERKGIPATFFINTGFVDNNKFLHRFKLVLLSLSLKKDKTDALKNKLEEYLNLHFTCRYKAAKHVMTLRYPQLNQIDKIISYLELDIYDRLKEFKPYMSREDIIGLNAKGFTIGAHSVDHPEFYLINEEQQLEQACLSMKQIEEWFNPRYKVFAFPFTDVGVKTSFFEKLEQQCKPDLTFACAGLKKDKISNHVHRIPMDNYNLNAKECLKSEFLYYFFKKFTGNNLYKRQ